jgi:Trypsin-like peptidase domain/Effector-associated domain 1
MALDAEQRGSLRVALRAAFPTRASWQELADGMDLNVDTLIATYGGDPIFGLVQEANSRGRENALVNRAIALNATNPDLRQFYERNWLPLSAPARKQLETMIRPGEQFEDIESWIERLKERGPQVCAITCLTTGGTLRGTGFLVAPNLVLTNYHVLEPVILGEQGKVTPPGGALPAGLSAKASGVSFVFDYKETPSGGLLNNGRSSTLTPGALSDWLIDHSPYSPLDLQSSPASETSDQELDYALVRLADAPGEDSVGSAVRGYIPVPQTIEVQSDSALFIIQHPRGRPLKLAFHVVKDILSTRITYGTNTLEGSSGSPCFNYRWDLVAIHHSGDPTYSAKRNQGVPIEQIFKLLTSRGVSLQ